MVVFAQQAAPVLLELARVELVRDLGGREGPLQLLEGRQVQLVVLRDARHVQRHDAVAQERDAIDADRLPAVAVEDVVEFVRRLVVVARHDALLVVLRRRVHHRQLGERPRPVPRLWRRSK